MKPQLSLRSLNAWRWASFGELLSRALAPITLLVVSRILGPGDYGLYVGALVFIAFFLMLVESGIARALVQTKGEIEAVSSSAFYFVSLVGLAFAVLLWGLADPISVLLVGDVAGSSVIAVLGLQVPIVALGAVPRAILERELRFRPIFAGRLMAVVVTGTISIWMAVEGFGIWALVVGALAGALTDVVVLWSASRFRPAGPLSNRSLAALAGFATWTTGHDILAWIALYADALMVAAFLDVEQLGKYRLGTLMVTSAFAVFFVPAEKVLFSMFAKLRDSGSVARALCPLLLLGMLVSLTGGLLLFALHAEIEALVFDERWLGIGLVLGLVGLQNALSNTVFAVDAAYKGVGRPDMLFKVRIVSLAIFLVAQFVALRISFESFLVARVLASLPILFLILFVARRFFGPCGLRWTASYSIGLVLVLVLAVMTLGTELWPQLRVVWLIGIAAVLPGLCVVFLRVFRRAASTLA